MGVYRRIFINNIGDALFVQMSELLLPKDNAPAQLDNRSLVEGCAVCLIRTMTVEKLFLVLMALVSAKKKGPNQILKVCVSHAMYLVVLPAILAILNPAIFVMKGSF